MPQKQMLKIFHNVDSSSFPLKTNWSSLKNEVDKLDIDKLVPVPTDLSKLSNVVKSVFVKKTVCDKLLAKVDNIDTNDFALKTKYQTDKTELKKKISDTSSLVKNNGL